MATETPTQTLPALGYSHYSKSEAGSLMVTLGAAADFSQMFVGGSLEFSF